MCDINITGALFIDEEFANLQKLFIVKSRILWYVRLNKRIFVEMVEGYFYPRLKEILLYKTSIYFINKSIKQTYGLL